MSLNMLLKRENCWLLFFAIDTYKFFLTGRKFLVRTDNSALSWLKTQKDPKGILNEMAANPQHLMILKSSTEPELSMAMVIRWSRASHAPFLSLRKKLKIFLLMIKFFSLGEAPEDDGQESDEDYDSLE